MSERARLDCAWRYRDLDASRTARGEGRVGWCDGNREPRLLDLAATRAKLRRHRLRLSLRYASEGRPGFPAIPRKRDASLRLEYRSILPNG